MTVLARAIECFILAVAFGLFPFGIGFTIGWITRGERHE